MSFIKPCHISVLSHTRRSRRRETSDDASTPPLLPFRIVPHDNTYASQSVLIAGETRNVITRPFRQSRVYCLHVHPPPRLRCDTPWFQLNCNQAREIAKQWGARGARFMAVPRPRKSDSLPPLTQPQENFYPRVDSSTSLNFETFPRLVEVVDPPGCCLFLSELTSRPFPRKLTNLEIA